MKDQELVWQLVSREHVYQDRWIDLRQSAYRMPDGSIAKPFYSYSRRDYVVIVATDEEGRYICVRQFRQGISEITNEFPAGGIETNSEREYTERSDIVLGDAVSGPAPAVQTERPEDTDLSGNSRKASTAEDALTAAKRELLEETGFESDDWKHILTIPSNATIADNYAHIFRAKNCRKVSEQELDDTEFLKVLLVTPDQIEAWIEAGEFQQMAHLAAWLLISKEIR